MEFSYLAYSMERGVVKGRLKARSELEARQQVSREGYKLLRLAPVRRFPGISQHEPQAPLLPILYQRPTLGVTIGRSQTSGLRVYIR